ncbi:hypothetical protein [Dongia sp.]|uniref:hypothetical protein n=1 Tax=Dongia sp. TaxID=1977262 RepID=UPI0035B1A763
MRTNRTMRKWAGIAGLILSMALAVGCGTQSSESNLWARLTAANLLAGSLAQGLGSVTEARAIVPGSPRAVLIAQGLDAVALSLDSAGDALRAGLPAVAESQIGAAETQLDGLKPLVVVTNGDAQ